jgi:hypothetical protein
MLLNHMNHELESKKHQKALESFSTSLNLLQWVSQGKALPKILTKLQGSRRA